MGTLAKLVSIINPLSKKDATKEIGATGLEVYSGFINNDYNTEWKDEQRITTVLEMRNDGQVAAILRAIKMPIVNLDWFITVPNEEDPTQQEHAAFITDSLFNKQEFKRILVQALSMLDFGFFYFEKIWKIEDGNMVLDRLAPRLQSAHYKWAIKNGQPGVTQLISSDIVEETMPEIPAHKLLLFTFDAEGDDPSGIPLIRPAYIHWKIKNLLYKIEVMASERFRAGIPIAHYADQATKPKLVEFLKNIISNQKAFGAFQGKTDPSSGEIKKNIDFSFLTAPTSGEAVSSMDNIQHHNRMIAQSVLAQHISLGESNGTQALGKTFSEDFKLMLMYVVEHLKWSMNHLIKEMIFWRFGEQEVYPKMDHADFDNMELSMYMNAIKTALDSQTLDIDPKLKRQVRAILKLPLLTEEEEAQIEAEKAQQQVDIDGNPVVDPNKKVIKKIEKKEVKKEVIKDEEPPKKKEEKKLDELEMNDEELLDDLKKKAFDESEELTKWDKQAQKTLGRVLTLAEKKVDFDAIQEFLNNSESELAQALNELTEQQKELFFNKLEKQLTAEDVKAINEQQIQLNSQLVLLIKNAAISALLFGKINESRELKVIEPATPIIFGQVITGEVEDLMNNRNQQLMQDVKSTIRESLLKGVGAIAAIAAARKIFEEKSNQLNQSIVSFVSAQNVNRGRQVVTDTYINLFHGIMRSEILDLKTCNFCISLDGRIMNPRDPFAKLGPVHNNCRGINVAILKEETPLPKITGIPQTLKNRIETVEGVPSTNAFKQLKKPIVTKDSRAKEKNLPQLE